LTSIRNGIHCILDCCVSFGPFTCTSNGIRYKLECVMSPMSMNHAHHLQFSIQNERENSRYGMKMLVGMRLISAAGNMWS
jgi:hypothetical protein